jgi:SprT protein
VSAEVLPELAEAYLDELLGMVALNYRPCLEWRPYRVTAGVAFYRIGVIALSKIVIRSPEQLRTTLAHEFAHLLAYQRHGRSGTGHGRAWKQAMRELGQEPLRTHSYEVTRNTARQEVGYRCARCGAMLVRRRRLPKGRRYVHARCGGDLRLSFVQPASATAAS